MASSYLLKKFQAGNFPDINADFNENILREKSKKFRKGENGNDKMYEIYHTFDRFVNSDNTCICREKYEGGTNTGNDERKFKR